MKTARVLMFGLILALGLGTVAAAEEWEIEPQPDPRLKAGGLSVVGGELDAEPVQFVLKNISLSQPIEVVLAATAGSPVEIVVYKDNPEKALATEKATKDKPAILHFRTGDAVYFTVRGETGARYQLLTWVGPEIDIEEPGPVVAVSEYPASPPRIERTSTTAAQPTSATDANSAKQPTGALVLGVWPSVILGLILLALIAIIVLLWRRGGRSTAAIIFLPIFVHATFAASIPKKITPEEEDAKIKATVDREKQLGDILDKIAKAEGPSTEGGLVKKPTKTEEGTEYAKDPSKTGIWNPIKITKEPDEKSKAGDIDYVKALKNVAAATKFVLAFYETYGFIDPREAAIRKNMNPPGMPLLPSKCAKDERCRACFKKATSDLDETRNLLEEQYVIYKQTEAAAGRIIDMADAAASMSGIAKLVWDQEKNSEAVSKPREEFYAHYDANLEKLLRNLNNALIAQGACERDTFGDQDWYNRYGWIYYTFMRDRYTRK